MTTTKLIDRLDIALLKVGKSRGDLADAIGISTQAISNLKRRERGTLRPENVAKAARWLRCDIYWLCVGEGKYRSAEEHSPEQRCYTFLAVEIANWFDALNEADRARAFTICYQMMTKGNWPKFEADPDRPPA